MADERNLPYRSRDADGYRADNNEEDEEEDVDESGYKTVRDAVLFAIEVSGSMLKRPPPSENKKADTNSPFSAALKCAYSLMQQRIISSPNDLMGILLYGTETTKFYKEDENSRGGWSFPHCYLLTDLDIPEAGDVKTLKNLVEQDSDEAEEIFKPSKEPVSMHTVLFCANQIFQMRAANFSSRRLFIVTDNDDPHASSRAFRSQATVRAKDLYDLGVIIELFPISTPEHTFDSKLFYDDIVYKSSPSDPDAVSYNPSSLTDIDPVQLKTGTTDGISLLQSLLSTISSRAAPKRALFSSVPLEIAPNLKISVKGYLLYKHQKPARSCYIYLGSDKPQIAIGETQITTSNTQNNLVKPEVRKAFTFGGEQIIFTPEELKKLRDFGDPVIRIICFKSMDKLPFWANIKTSTFLYPSEDDYVGSTRVYSALYQKLVKSRLFALTWFIPRRNAAPVMAAMIPTLSAESTEEKSNDAGVSPSGCPQGLHLIPLPFADDIRSNPPTMHDTPIRAPDELVDAMRPIIQQLNLPKGIYDPQRYANPSLQWHYRILQAMALDEDLPDKPEDKTRPKYKQIDKRVGNEAIEWGQTLDRVYKEYLADNPHAVPVGAKRSTTAGKSKTSNGDDGIASKKVKSEGDGGMTEEAMRKLFEKGKVASLTVAQLKDFAATKQIPVGGKKGDLVDRIEGWFESK